MRHPLGCATWIGVVLFMASLAGCASVPQFRYYTIDMQQGATLDPPARLTGVSFKVNEALAKPEILIRTSPTQIEYYALDRWASSLEEQLAEKFKTEFAGASGDRPPVNVTGRLMAFEQVDTSAGPEVRIKLDIRAEGNPGDFGLQKLYTASRPITGTGAAGAVEMLSRATEEIAAQFSADLVSAIAEGSPQ